MRKLSKGAGEGDEREKRSMCHPENPAEGVFQRRDHDQPCQGCREAKKRWIENGSLDLATWRSSATLTRVFME